MIILAPMENKQKKAPLTSAQRRALGHFDFKLGFVAFVASVNMHLGSLLANNPQWAEFLNVSTAISFGVALLGFALMGYNFTKSTPSPKK
ncbi:MAG: hypothetical protein WCT22_02325 [Patescibacteria group bacterium]|jgi:hypothetical protein